MSTLRVILFVCLLSGLTVFAQTTRILEQQSIVPNTTLTAETTTIPLQPIPFRDARSLPSPTVNASTTRFESQQHEVDRTY